MRVILVVIVCLLLAVAPTNQEANERHYVIVFTWEAGSARLSHSFATFIKVASVDGQNAAD